MILKKKQNVIIISHFHIRAHKGGGPPQDIRDYLLDKINTICYIELPFSYANDQTAYCSIYIQGELSKQFALKLFIVPEIIIYLEHILIINYFILKSKYRYNFAIALDNLSTVSLYLLRTIKILYKIIYYSIDYTPRRFDSELLNNTYQTADKIACRISDKNWVVSEPMITARKNKNIKVNNDKFIIVPIGFHAERIKLKHNNKINRFKLVFMGSVVKKQGIQLIISSLPQLLIKFPKITFTIIGKGDYLSFLQKKVNKLRLNKVVNFTGFINKHEDVEKILTNCGVGIATYMPTKNSFTYYADPGKIKQYLGCGLPVITTSVPSISNKIDLYQSGVIVQYNKKAVVDGISKVIKNKKSYYRFRRYAIKHSKQFGINKIMNDSFLKS